MSLKKAIKSCFHKFGFDIHRISREAGNEHSSGGDPTTIVAGYRLVIPNKGELAGLYDRYPHYLGQLRRLTAFLRRKFPDLLAIDVGANFGDSLALIKGGADIPTVCIEGDAKIFPLLERNSKQFSQVTLIQRFLDEKDSQAKVTLEKEGWNTTLSSKQVGDAGQVVTLYSLDRTLEEQPSLSEHILLKIDVEGYEPGIIKGAKRLLTQKRPVLVIEYNADALGESGKDGPEMLDLLAQWNYGPTMLYENMGAYIATTDLTEPANRREIDRYSRDSIRGCHYQDLVIFPNELRPTFQEFRHEEANR